jgi:hypothetical protein
MKNYDNRDLATLLAKFKRHLTCWQVGLSLGSLLYFHMGDRWRAETKSGSIMEIGSTTLVLEADDWTITSQGHLITDSDSVTQDCVDRLVFKYFIGKSLKSIEYTNESKECLIYFADQGRVPGEILIRLRGETDEDMCTITFPDGTIIVCNAKNGFLSDGSRSDVHVAAYSSD